jgi:hypothetical protein
MKTCDLIVAAAVIVLGFGAARAQDVSFGQRLFRDISPGSVPVHPRRGSR